VMSTAAAFAQHRASDANTAALHQFRRRKMSDMGAESPVVVRRLCARRIVDFALRCHCLRLEQRAPNCWARKTFPESTLSRGQLLAA
jgi:hypothetical protein